MLYSLLVLFFMHNTQHGLASRTCQTSKTYWQRICHCEYASSQVCRCMSSYIGSKIWGNSLRCLAGGPPLHFLRLALPYSQLTRLWVHDRLDLDRPPWNPSQTAVFHIRREKRALCYLGSYHDVDSEPRFPRGARVLSFWGSVY